MAPSVMRTRTWIKQRAPGSAGTALRKASRRTFRAHCNVEYSALRDKTVISAETGEPVDLTSLWQATPGVRVVLPLLTHFADLSSWEYAQKLVQRLPDIEAQGARVIAVGLGSAANAREFSRVLNFPLDKLYADETAAVHRALGFSRGFGAELDINPYFKLLPMLMGIGSPGTVQEVLRGYVGDRDSKPVFTSPTPFDVLGTGYQRPFELATLRLLNMVGILPKWSELSPPDASLLTQQGGTLALDGEDTLFLHADSGILKYTDIDALLAALAAAPRVLPA